jgi:hypothetical protein
MKNLHLSFILFKFFLIRTLLTNVTLIVNEFFYVKSSGISPLMIDNLIDHVDNLVCMSSSCFDPIELSIYNVLKFNLNNELGKNNNIMNDDNVEEHVELAFGNNNS